MKKSTTMALAFLTLSAAVAGVAYAAGSPDNAGPGMPLEQMDADKNGEITFEEFNKAAGDRFVLADTNKDGKVTVEEMAAAIEKMRAERMAKRMIDKFDADNDGSVTTAEIETGQKKIYALLDRNNDGKVVASEFPRKGKHGFGHGGRHGGWFGGNDGPDGSDAN